MKKAWIFLSCFFLVATCCAPRNALATTWNKVGSFPYQILSMYFADAEHGIIGTGSVPGDDPVVAEIYLTTDAGISWTKAVIPTGYSAVSDIFMTDSKHGWAAVGGGIYTLWRTNDGGYSWREECSVTGSFGVGVYETSSALITTDLFSYSRISTDKCASYKRVMLNSQADAMIGIDFTDDKHGVITSYRNGGKWVRTTDGGRTWIETDQSVESWSVYAAKGTSSFYTAEEGNRDGRDYLTKIRRSDDHGATWRVVRELPFRSTGHITGTGNILYVQTASSICVSCAGYSQGIYRSSDGGESWTALGGPDNLPDRRFKVVPTGCNTVVVYAADDRGGLYTLTDDVEFAAGGTERFYASQRKEDESSVSPGSFVDVNVMVTFAPTLNVDTLSPKVISFTINYNEPPITSTVEDIKNSFKPPFGWKFAECVIHEGSLSIVLENTGSAKLMDDQHLGVVRLAVEPDAVKSGYISLKNVEVYTGCMDYVFSCMSEGEYLKYVNLQKNAVQDNITIIENLSVYPNPAKNIITIATSPFIKEEGTLILHDALGKEVYKTTVNSPSTQIDVAQFASGSYYVSLSRNGSTITKRVEIVK